MMGICIKAYNILIDWVQTHHTDINVNIFAGIIASIIVLSFQGLVKTLSLIVAAFVTLKWQLRTIWRLDKPTRIYVVSGSILGVNEDVQSVILAGPDADAANMLIGTLGLLYPEAEVKHMYSSSFMREFYKEHLVIVGGPVNNNCSASVLNQIRDHICFNDDLDLLVSNIKYATVYNANQQPEKDYGVIIRMVNPFSPTKDIIMAMGCDTHGVLAAASLISSRPDDNKTKSMLKKSIGIRRYFCKTSFIAVVSCEVLGNDISKVDLVDYKRLPEK
jgi:hypothetical protein